MSESEQSDYEEADDITSGAMSVADVDRIRLQLSDKCAGVNDYLLSSREPVDKRRLVENALLDLFTAFNQMSANYLRVSAACQAANYCKNVLAKTIKQEVAAAVQKALPSLTASVSGGSSSSYADVASGASKQGALKVRITNGPTVVVPSTVSVVIGPKAACAPNFDTADATRKAIMKAVKPAEVNLRVNKVVNTRNKAVRIIADSLDVAKLKTCQALYAAGLDCW